MQTTTVEQGGVLIAVVNSAEPLITDEQSALDFMATVRYETQSDRVALNKEAIAEDFFVLSTRLAGNVLQKFVNYSLKFAVYGDFSQYSSKALRDFIYECNRGSHVYFAKTSEEATEWLAMR